MSIRTWGAAGLAAAVFTCAASGAVLQSGMYRLHNHPDGSARPPTYGAKFDELYNATGGHDVFTLDFDAPVSSVFMFVNPTMTEVRIYGLAWGGRDVGSGYANDAYLGLYTFEFVYDMGVGMAPGDDDLMVSEPHHRNFGTLVTPLGHTVHLTDEAMGGYSFRFGDTDNDAGHRGFNGLSGWGWMSYVTPGGVHHISDTDWLFTAELVPTPGAMALLGLGALSAARRRRRR